MSPQVLDALHQQYETYPTWSYQLQVDNLAALLAEHPELGTMPSYSTVVRRMKEKGWNKKGDTHQPQTPGQKQARERLASREVRSFESEYVNGLWHLDFHEGRQGSGCQWSVVHTSCLMHS